jgi:hypothetical protein
LLNEVDVIIMATAGDLVNEVIPFTDARHVFVMVPPHKLKEEDFTLGTLKQQGCYENVFIVPLAENASSAVRVSAAIQQIRTSYDTIKLSEKIILAESSTACDCFNRGSKLINKILKYNEVFDVRPILVDSILSDNEQLPVLGTQQEKSEMQVTCATYESGKKYRASGLFLICVDCLDNNLPLLIAATHKNGVHVTPEPVKIYDLFHYLFNVGIPATIYSGEF